MSEELAYIAGLVDGEGYLGLMKETRSVHKHGCYYCPAVKVTNGNEEMIRYLHGRFGGTVARRTFPGKNSKDAWAWSLTNHKPVKAFLQQIRPWLRIKAAQADILLAFSSNHVNVWGCHGVSDEEFALRTSAYLEIRRLNHRGLPPTETNREDTLIVSG